MTVIWLVAFVAGVAMIVWGAEAFAEHLGAAAVRLGVSSFALALLLAGAEPEELATVVTAALRGAPGIGLGDVIGANVAICLVALGVGAWIAPLHFRRPVMRTALLSLPLGAIAAWFAWDGRVGRAEGGVLVVLYAVFVAAIWWLERAPPALGEVGELAEARASAASGGRRSVGRDLLVLLAGVVAMAAGATLLVAAVQQISGVDSTQTRLGLTLVGFATGFELVVLAWSAARRGIADTVLAGVLGSYAYNGTMTLGAGALARPLVLRAPALLHLPLLLMLGALALVVTLAARRGRLARAEGVLLLTAYPLFVLLVLTR
ncbi:sodium:calcium antiporter [Lichenicoccus sp.]|uniref:sodium:calcium antiporter n=1 Tax=Lichenicoccus sp. TaxID=2781899 RepID=UPI003D0A5B7F